MSKRHLIIPDMQLKKGVPTKQIEWIAEAINKYKPDVVVNIGDWYDFPSLSAYDGPGTLKMEGQRYEDDLEAGNEGWRMLNAGITHKCKKYFLIGNHEQRVLKAINKDPRLAGTIGFHQMLHPGWERVEYFNGSPGQIELDDIAYAHFFSQPNTGKPIGGTIQNRLSKIGQSFVQGHVQGLMQGSLQLATGRMLQGIQAGSCLAPDHKVLTADLRYVPLGTVKEGDKLVSFDEYPTHRHKRTYRTGTVEAVKVDEAECFEVTLNTGKVFKVTEDHYWLTRVGGQLAMQTGSTYKWRQTSDLRVGTIIPQILPEWEPMEDYDGGYLSGMYDGEGSLYARPTVSDTGACMALALSQKPGMVLEKTRDILEKIVGNRGLINGNQKGVDTLRIRGGSKYSCAVLGSVRPIRLLSKFRPELMGSIWTKDNHKIVSIRKIGTMPIIRIAIDAKTMVVEGYPHHNCYLHDESYKGQANRHWRGIVVLNEVRKGEFCEMPLSVDYLCREFEGMGVARFLQRNYRDAKSRFSLANKE